VARTQPSHAVVESHRGIGYAAEESGVGVYKLGVGGEENVRGGVYLGLIIRICANCGEIGVGGVSTGNGR